MILLKDLLFEAKKGPEIKTLKKHKVPLTDDEREKVVKAGAVWHPTNQKKPTPAVQKAVVKGKTWYWCATHRYGVVKPTLKGAIAAFPEVKETA